MFDKQRDIIPFGILYKEDVPPLLASLDIMESGTLEQFGSEKMAMFIQLLFEYDKARIAVIKK